MTVRSNASAKRATKPLTDAQRRARVEELTRKATSRKGKEDVTAEVKVSKYDQWLGTGLGVVSGATTLYWGSILSNIVALAALALTGWVFLSWLIWFIGLVVTLVMAFQTMNEVGTYIGSGKCRSDVHRACGWVKSFFRNDDSDVTDVKANNASVLAKMRRVAGANHA